MTKFIFKDSGKEVKLGDRITMKGNITLPFVGVTTIMQEVPVNAETLAEMIERGMVVPVESPSEESVPMELSHYVEKLAQRLNKPTEDIVQLLMSMDKVYPVLSFSLLLREIAIELDKKYKDHIENSPEIYVVSLLDGRITKANKACIRNYRNFAAFRTLEDARTACRIMSPVMKTLFGSGK